METLVVVLPRYNYSLSFDTTRFLERFPDSLIAVTYENTHESVIPLDNPSVTSDVLTLLSQIITTGPYPYVPVQYKRSFDYLGIDLPDRVNNPKYQDVIKVFPDIDLDNLEGKNYIRVLDLELSMSFPELAQYVFAHTLPTAHSEDDYKIFQDIIQEDITPSNEDVTLMLLRNRDIRRSIASGDIYQIFDNIQGNIGRPYSPTVVVTFIKMFPQVIDNSEFVEWVLNQIRANPRNYPLYLSMLKQVGDYIPVDSDQYDLYQIITWILNGNRDELKSHNPIDNYIITTHGYDQLLIYLALVYGHYDIAIQLLWDAIEYFQFARYTQDDLHKWLHEFTSTYFRGVILDKPEIIEFLKQAQNTIDTYRFYDSSFNNTLTQ